jgi:hypothetical protein
MFTTTIPHPKPNENNEKVNEVAIRNYVPSKINPVYRQTQKQNLHFNTKFRKQYYITSPSDFHMNLCQPCEDIISLKLSSICIPNSWYLFSALRENNRFIVEIEAKCLPLSIHEIVIPDGNYDRESLEEYLNDRYFYNSGQDNPLQYIKFSINKHSLKTRFELCGQPDKSYKFNLKFVNQNTKSIVYTAGWILGFRYGQYLNVDTYVLSEGLFNCGGDRYFYFCLNDYNKNVNTTNVVFFQNSTMKYDVLAKIYLIDGKFSINIDENADDENNQTRTRKYHGPVNLQKFDVTLLDEFGRIINLNNMDFSFVLEVEKLYRKI